MSVKTRRSRTSASSNLDSSTTMKVCRVCLATSVKMYHMSEHQLSVMYERVVGVPVNKKSILPQMLCWECVARLSSANNFKEKALKTHRILINRIKGRKSMTRKIIKSIDRSKNQLESTLGYEYKVNESNLNIIEEMKTETNDNERVEEEDEDDRERNEMKVEVDIDFNQEQSDVIKKEPVEIDVDDDDEVNNEIVDISVVKNEIDYDEIVIDIREETPTDEIDNEKSEEDPGVIEQEEREIDTSQWNMNLCELERIARNDTDQLITLQSPDTNEQTTEAKRTGENLTRITTERTDITKLRICGTCNKSLRSMRTANITNYRPVIKLNYKTSQRKSNETSDSCDMCNKAFPRNAQTFLFKCTFCHFETNNKYRLNTHINSKHTKKIRYTCSYCSFKTYVKVKLGSHVNVTHTECLTCLYCGYVAKFKSYLNKHMCSQHANTKVFSCNYCTYSSKQKGSLDKHFVDVHTEVASGS